MTLIVQDDTGLVIGANSYASNADFRAYQDARGRKYLDDDDKIDAALVKGTDYVDQRFRFTGRKLNARNQLFQWPRMACYDADRNPVQGVPQEVKDATCEYALRALTAELNPDPLTDATEQRVTKKSVTVGPITKTTEFNGSVSTALPKYPAADMILRRAGFIISGGELRRG